MPRLTVTITDEQAEWLEEISKEEGEYESKSEAVRNLIQAGERAAELETEIERLRNEKRTLVQQHKEHTDLVEYVSDELSYREAPLSTRLRWFLFGKSR